MDAGAFGDTPCFAYDSYQEAQLDKITPIDMSEYSLFTVSFWTRYDTEGGFDYLYFQAGGAPNPTNPLLTLNGSSGGWVQKQVTFDNADHSFDSFYMRFFMSSDATFTASGGVFIDDITITAPTPNLTYVTPSGWSGPIVPSMTTGTTTTGTNLQAGEYTYFDWAIRNADAGTAQNVSISYYLDGQIIGSDFVFSLAGNTNYTRTDWAYIIPTEGSHTVRMVIDSTGFPGGSIPESNENDNGYSAIFTWFAADLVVDSMTVTVQPPLPSPPLAGQITPSSSRATVSSATMGQTVDIAVKVRNRGNQASTGSTRLDWYRDRSSPPPELALGDQTKPLGPLGPGASQVLHFTATGTRAETWRMYAYVDPQNVTTEVHNDNNILGPASLQWNPKQIYVTGTFFYDDSLRGTTTTPCNDVQVIDTNDPNTDDVLGSAPVCCLNTGRFTIGPIINEDTDDDHSFLDLFVRVNYRSNEACWDTLYPGNWFVTMAHANRSPWHFDTGVSPNFNGDTLNVGPLKPTAYGDRWALHMLRTAIDYGWTLIRHTVVPPESITGVTVQWDPATAVASGSGTSDYIKATRAIEIAGNVDATGLLPDEWDDVVLLHEYGHHVAFWGGFDLDNFAPDDALPHFFDHPANVNTAWNEGWAHFFAGAAQPLGGLRTNVGRTPGGLFYREDFELERGRYLQYHPLTSPGWTSSDIDTVINVNDKGAQWEGAIGGTLWDIIDAQHDNQNGDAFSDSLTDTFQNVYNAFHTGSPPGVDTARVIFDVFRARMYYDSLAANPRTNVVKFGLSQRVFWEHGILGGPVLAGIEVSPTPATVLRITRIFPNPGNPHIYIRFLLPNWAVGKAIRLAVFDVRGRLVRDLRPGRLEPGQHELVWDGRTGAGIEAASGLYVCRLSAGERAVSRKLTLLR